MRHTLIPTINFGRDQILPIATVENHSNEHASYKSPALTNVFESPNNSPFISLLLQVA